MNTQFDPNELRRIAHGQQQISDETAADGAQVGLGAAASMLPFTRTATSCESCDLAAAASYQDITQDMTAHAANIQQAAEVYESTDDELATGFDLNI